MSLGPAGSTMVDAKAIARNPGVIDRGHNEIGFGRRP